MQPQFDHGPRLTDEEYEKRIIALQKALPPMPSKEMDRASRRAALNLAIDHRLGVDFPIKRREALWAIQENVEKRRLWLVFHHILKDLFRQSLASKAQGLARFLVDEYAKVLTQAELDSFFGSDEAKNPTLPIDERKL